MGAASAVLAELVRPGLFDRLVLIEPILFGPPDAVGQNAAVPPELKSKHPLYAATIKRKDAWASRDEAAAYYLASRGCVVLHARACVWMGARVRRFRIELRARLVFCFFFRLPLEAFLLLFYCRCCC